MKQSTQKFLARLLALLLVLGLAPAAWGEIGLVPEASAATSADNDPYILADGTRVNNGGSANLYWSSGNRQMNFSVGYPNENKTLNWYVNGHHVTSSDANRPTSITSYLTAYVSNGVLYVTAAYGYSNSYYTVSVQRNNNSTTYSTCTVYTDYNNSYGSLAYVNVGTSYNYALGDRDVSGNTSIVSQLLSRSGVYSGAYVVFTGSTSSTYGSLNVSGYGNSTAYYLNTNTSYANYLGNVVFTPSGTAGTAVFSIRLYYGTNNNSYLDGTIAFNTSGTTTTTGDIPYSGVVGESVYFNVADFENFYYDKTNGGTLTSVRFSTPSSGTGTLYSNNGSRLSSTTDCYASPTGSRTALDGVYFTPSGTTATRGTTVRISFTAYGNRNYSSSYNSTISGTVVITYLNNSAHDITYRPVNGSVNFSSTDFTNVYRDVIGSTAPSSLTIQFQSVPSSGTLTYRSGTSSSVRLTSSNIRSYRFTASQLNDITYTASGTYTDSIEYIAYTSGTTRYTGKVIFNPTAASTMTVLLNCPSGSGVAFNLAAFTQANSVVMASCSQIQFTIPGNGSLTYANSAVGINGVTVPVSMLNQVYYRPNTYFNSTDRVAFICYDAAGNQIGAGQVNITVTGNSNTGAYDVSQFTDVPATAWYRAELADLVSKGIMQGKGNGRFDPTGQVKNGEALKMILLAAGYPQQTEPSGNDWAINYKTLAVNNNLISSSVVLNNNMSRNAVAELAAKALGLTPVTSGSSPFTDSTNGYAIALYNAGILTGDTTSGSRKFLGNDTLQRAEICAIIYRINSYKNQQSNERPSWLS